jgi:hypothetical protein
MEYRYRACEPVQLHEGASYATSTATTSENVLWDTEMPILVHGIVGELTVPPKIDIRLRTLLQLRELSKIDTPDWTDFMYDR